MGLGVRLWGRPHFSSTLLRRLHDGDRRGRSGIAEDINKRLLLWWWRRRDSKRRSRCIIGAGGGRGDRSRRGAAACSRRRRSGRRSRRPAIGALRGGEAGDAVLAHNAVHGLEVPQPGVEPALVRGGVGDGEDEDPQLGAGDGQLVELLDHVVEILGGGDGDERVEALVGELVLDGEVRARGAAVGVGEAREEVLQRHPARHGHDPGVAAGVPQRPVPGPRQDAAAEAAQKLHPIPTAAAAVLAGGGHPAAAARVHPPDLSPQGPRQATNRGPAVTGRARGSRRRAARRRSARGSVEFFRSARREGRRSRSGERGGRERGCVVLKNPWLASASGFRSVSPRLRRRFIYFPALEFPMLDFLDLFHLVLPFVSFLPSSSAHHFLGFCFAFLAFGFSTARPALEGFGFLWIVGEEACVDELFVLRNLDVSSSFRLENMRGEWVV